MTNMQQNYQNFLIKNKKIKNEVILFQWKFVDSLHIYTVLSVNEYTPFEK